MNIGLYSPYFDTLGGGERYVLTLASHWSARHTVHIFWNDDSILKSAQERFNIDLSKIKVVRNIFRNTSVFKKLYITRQYDLIFVLSDGSIPSTIAKYNILHFQVPFAKIPHSAIKFLRYQAVICNSNFTKNALDWRAGFHSQVIYPPVAPVSCAGGKKKNIILSVGRFTHYHTAKKQHVLIDAFRVGLKRGKWDGWRLILAGGLMPDDQEYISRLREMAKGIPVTIEANISLGKLADYYRDTRIYWHAGYGERDARFMEHFGISTVEAMSAGAVPIVFHGGGQTEIIDQNENGFLWNCPEDLIEKTSLVMTDQRLASVMQQKAMEKSKQFSVSRFRDAFDEVLSKMTL